MTVQIVSPEKAVEVLTIELECKKEKIEELRAEVARLTAGSESMQEDAVQNTYAFGLMLKSNKEQAEDIRTQEDEIGRLRHLLYTHNIEWEMK